MSFPVALLLQGSERYGTCDDAEQLHNRADKSGEPETVDE